jgi:hypothetical protein
MIEELNLMGMHEDQSVLIALFAGNESFGRRLWKDDGEYCCWVAEIVCAFWPLLTFVCGVVRKRYLVSYFLFG